MTMRTAAIALAMSAASAAPAADLARRVSEITRTTPWTRVAAIEVRFETFHPQGMVRIGDTFYVSSVDRARAAGHLFKIDGTGNLLADIQLGEAAMFHPGGIDYDGRFIWVPVAEYRPDSHAIVYRVDPQAMKATEVFRCDDHIGAIVHDTDDHTLRGVSWGSRRFYRWTLDADLRVADPGVKAGGTLNPSHYVDYQDCMYAGGHTMICTGVAELRPPSGPPFRLGGLELVDLVSGRPIHQVPVPLWTSGGRVMTENPSWFETSPSGLRGYFMPEDEHSTIYIFEAAAR
jgi:Family of unknown function (DUF6454)